MSSNEWKVTPAFISNDAVSTINAAIEKYRNWDRFGKGDKKGTVNYITPEKRVEATKCVKTGKTISCAMQLNEHGPQTGELKRNNPLHLFTLTGTDYTSPNAPKFPHGVAFTDDYLTMPLQAGTQWDGLGHTFSHGSGYGGTKCYEHVDAGGDRFTGIEVLQHDIVSRGVLLDIGRMYGKTTPEGVEGVLPDGWAIKEEHLLACMAKQKVTIGKGDIVLVRTGQMERYRKTGWGTYAGGDAPGMSFDSLDWIHRTQIAAIATDTWGFEVRPNEFPNSYQPCHQVCIPNMGLLVGEVWDLAALGADCAADGVYEFLLTASPLPVTGAVGAPLNPIAMK
ncbi:putative cyclase [Gonapodya prolifera JEL478]|uniref:Putative cyclase n=1 Tax=Gonapodya prolifera (strain JEL478) TaxID=1344416 RepID=A0A138ZZ13_GONPJ|nr:putative cyclase [Gonapodya prolifera JEL478]|eukprot:KXS09515.1 putative cyclase [Gonapodya prolifera JEL478]